VRNAVAEALGQDFVVAARARGLPERVVIWQHGLRNGLLPVVTLAGLYLPVLFAGAVATEAIFAWPGMGRVTIEAVWGRDYPVVMATTFLAGVTVTLGSLSADLFYSVVDPRVRRAGGDRSE
jgi:peptide/nickel transport system permease protein